MASVNISDSQQVHILVAEVDAAGQPVGTPLPDSWTSSDPSVVTVGPDSSDPSGLNGLAVAVGPVGQADITASVQVTAADGTTSTVTSQPFTVVVEGGPVAGVNLSAGTVEPKPSA